MRSLTQAALALLASALLFSCTEKGEFPAIEKEKDQNLLQESEFLVPGRLVVEFEEDIADGLYKSSRGEAVTKTKSSEINTVLESLGAVQLERVFPDAGEMEERHRKAGLHRFYYVTFDEGLPQTKAAESLDRIKGVRSAQPERVKVQTGSYGFNDPEFKNQWNMYNPGNGDHYVKGMDVNVAPVWKNYTAGRKDVIVGVVDGGVDMNHPDLAASVIPAGPNGSCSFVTGHSGYDVVPDNHGTHVAGVIAAINNNGKGITGIAGGNDGTGGVKILSAAMFMDDPDDPTKSISGNSSEAIVWAADHGAVICQNSWSYVYKSAEDARKGYIDAADKAAIDYFIANAGTDKDGKQTGPMKGGLVVFAAGNSSQDAGWPSMYEPVVAVGALSSIGTAAYYSNYGSWVDICAPGGDAQLGPQILSTVVNGYDSMQGTSMACPHVSGVAALIVSYFGGEGFTNTMLKEKLLKGAKQDYKYAYRIGPMVDALGSITYGTTMAPDPVDDYTLSVNSNTITCSWKVTADPDDKTAHHYDIVAATDKSLIEGYPETRNDSGVLHESILVEDHDLGDVMTGSLNRLAFDEDYFVAIVAADYQDNCSAVSDIKSMRTGKNNAPFIEALGEYTYPVQVPAHMTIELEYRLGDADGHKYNSVFVTGSDAASFGMGSQMDIKKLTIIGKKEKPGNYEASIRLIDEYGAENMLKIPYTIVPNHVPKVLKDIEDVIFTEIGEQISMPAEEYFKDEDGEKLTYSVATSTPGIAHAYEKNGSIYIAALSYGYTEVMLKATDTCGDSCTATFHVLVRDPASGPDVEIDGDKLKIMAYYDGEVQVLVTNRSGASIINEKYTGKVLEPYLVDFDKAAPGIYGVKATYDGRTFTRTIVKK